MTAALCLLPVACWCVMTIRFSLEIAAQCVCCRPQMATERQAADCPCSSVVSVATQRTVPHCTASLVQVVCRLCATVRCVQILCACVVWVLCAEENGNGGKWGIWCLRCVVTRQHASTVTRLNDRFGQHTPNEPPQCHISHMHCFPVHAFGG